MPDSTRPMTLNRRADFQELARRMAAAVPVPPIGTKAPAPHSSHYTLPGMTMEAGLRPLWALLPLAEGGGDDGLLRGYAAWIAAGVDPTSPSFWGRADGGDQRWVENPVLASLLVTGRKSVFEKMDEVGRRHLVAWISRINDVNIQPNNWRYFRVLTNLFLREAGFAHDPKRLEDDLASILDLRLDEGWYHDGPQGPGDWYTPMAFHFYASLAAPHLTESAFERETARAIREAAFAFAPTWEAWFARSGRCVPFGRSLTYRFAPASFWGALAFAGWEALPWAEIRRLWQFHVASWFEAGWLDPDAPLVTGYAYPSDRMGENYNGSGASYWAFKAFLPLRLPAEHPFWTAEPSLPVRRAEVRVQAPIASIAMRNEEDGEVVLLNGGQKPAYRPRHYAAKYFKLVYSSAFGFSVPTGASTSAEESGMDGSLWFSVDGEPWRTRETIEEASVSGDRITSRWKAGPHVEVTTTLIASPPWHIRIHRIRLARATRILEGGFALGVEPDVNHYLPFPNRAKNTGEVDLLSSSGRSILISLSDSRESQVQFLDVGSNLIHPRAVLPVLASAHESGEVLLACAVLGLREGHERIDDGAIERMREAFQAMIKQATS